MILLAFMGLSLFVCFIWSFVLLKRILYMNSDEVISMSHNVSDRTSDNVTLTETKLKQLMPVKSESWILNRVIHQHRVWQKTSLDGIKLHAVTIKVKASASILSNFVRRVEMFREWRPGIVLSELISATSNRQHVRWRHRKLTYRLLTDDNIISWWLEPLLEEEVTTQRVFLSGAKYTGLIENTDLTSTAFICQPIIGLENDQCRLTAITSGDIYKVTEECQCLSDYFLMNRAPTEANETYKLNVPPDQQQREPERNDQGTNNNAAEEPPAPPDDIGEDEPRVNGYGEESFSDVSAGELDSPATNRPSDGEPQGCSEGGESGQEGGSKADHDNTLNINTASDRLNNGRPTLTKSVSLAVPSPRIESYKLSGKSRSEDIPYLGGGGTDSDVSDAVGSRSETVNGSQVVFLRTISSDNQGGLVDYKTLSNKCAADLLAEVLEASNIVQRPSTKDRGDTVPVQGWVFESTDRDVAILQKIDPHNQRLSSWLGKGLIKATPEALWQTIVNPYTRYIHDEMLKDVSVISDLGNGMKLVRLFYSTSQVLRKDNREFYLLQAERMEGKKNILTLCSVEWPEAEHKDCPRGKFEASGWIIEPIVSRNQNTYSMVTYLSQIDLGDLSTTGTQQFEEEFVTKQPNAISDLRNYLQFDVR